MPKAKNAWNLKPVEIGHFISIRIKLNCARYFGNVWSFFLSLFLCRILCGLSFNFIRFSDKSPEIHIVWSKRFFLFSICICHVVSMARIQARVHPWNANVHTHTFNALRKEWKMCFSSIIQCNFTPFFLVAQYRRDRWLFGISHLIHSLTRFRTTNSLHG